MEKLIGVTAALTKLLGWKSYPGTTNKHHAEYMKRFGLTIVSEMTEGKRKRQFVTQAAFDAAMERVQAEKKSTPTDDFPSDDKSSLAELHLGALETKVDRLDSKIVGLTDATNILVKQANLLVDRLDKVLKQLGESS